MISGYIQVLYKNGLEYREIASVRGRASSYSYHSTLEAIQNQRHQSSQNAAILVDWIAESYFVKRNPQ
jgi:hypothetical protein